MDNYTAIKQLLEDVGAKRLSTSDALLRLQKLRYEDIGFAKLDISRGIRRGFPEVVYCEGKTIKQVEKIVDSLLRNADKLLLTRADKKIFLHLNKKHLNLKFNEVAKVIYAQKKKNTFKKGLVLILTAGTSDIPVAEEARITLEVMGNRVETLYDVGVAGIHRLLYNEEILKRADIIIVVAGMDGALASVVSGLISKPVIAVPTSVGYGGSFHGIAPLLTMLNCCSPGVAVVNIDNGFGAGYFASLINR